MIRHLSTILILLGTSSIALGQGNNITQQVGVCDARTSMGANCIRPNSDGSIVTSGAPGAFTQLGYQQITSLSASTALTVPAGSTFALIVPETQAVRWRPDGSTTAPTASVGMPLAVAQPLLYSGDLAAIRFIEQAASAKLDITYGR